MDLLIKLLLTPVVQLLLLLLLCMLAAWRNSHHLKKLLILQLSCGLVLTCKPLADKLAAPLELAYPAFAQQRVDHIAVLGCRHANATFLPLSSQADPCSSARLLEAALLWRQQPRALVHLSGSIKDRREAHTEVARRFLVALGVPDQQIRLHPDATDTEGEITLLIQAIPATEPMALVTSAMHMPRAMRWFTSANRQPVAAPAGYHLRRNPEEPLHWQAWLPAVNALETYGYAFYEYAGLLEQHLRLRQLNQQKSG
ncbi:MAG: ElyC/SanA/YdcF family protein [Rheinheimera sp.]|nr:ElyC/SanA/YdcF family protein [Rheinheimera sp.]